MPIRVTHQDGRLTLECSSQKAVAKLLGGYDCLNGNTPLLAFKILAGCRQEQLVLVRWDDTIASASSGSVARSKTDSEADKGWICESLHVRGRRDTTYKPMAWPLCSDEGVRSPRDFNQVFLMLAQLVDMDCLMTCDDDSKDGVDARAIGLYCKNNGLMASHAYCILGIYPDVAGSGVDLIKLRDPLNFVYGEPEFPWSSGDATWDKFPQIKAAIFRQGDRDALKFSEQGIFFMSKSDFSREFRRVQIGVIPTPLHAGDAEILAQEQANDEAERVRHSTPRCEKQQKKNRKNAPKKKRSKRR